MTHRPALQSPGPAQVKLSSPLDRWENESREVRALSKTHSGLAAVLGLPDPAGHSWAPF